MKPLLNLGVATGFMLIAGGLLDRRPLLVPAGCALLALCAFGAALLWRQR